MLKKEDSVQGQARRLRPQLAGEALGDKLVQIGRIVAGEVRTYVAATLFRAGHCLEAFTRMVVRSTAHDGGQDEEQ